MSTPTRFVSFLVIMATGVVLLVLRYLTGDQAVKLMLYGSAIVYGVPKVAEYMPSIPGINIGRNEKPKREAR